VERISYDLNSDHMESFPIEPDHGNANKGGLAGYVALGSQSILTESVAHDNRFVPYLDDPDSLTTQDPDFKQAK